MNNIVVMGPIWLQAQVGYKPNDGYKFRPIKQEEKK